MPCLERETSNKEVCPSLKSRACHNLKGTRSILMREPIRIWVTCQLKTGCKTCPLRKEGFPLIAISRSPLTGPDQSEEASPRGPMIALFTWIRQEPLIIEVTLRRKIYSPWAAHCLRSQCIKSLLAKRALFRSIWTSTRFNRSPLKALEIVLSTEFPEFRAI